MFKVADRGHAGRGPRARFSRGKHADNAGIYVAREMKPIRARWNLACDRERAPSDVIT